MQPFSLLHSGSPSGQPGYSAAARANEATQDGDHCLDRFVSLWHESRLNHANKYFSICVYVCVNVCVCVIAGKHHYTIIKQFDEPPDDCVLQQSAASLFFFKSMVRKRLRVNTHRFMYSGLSVTMLCCWRSPITHFHFIHHAAITGLVKTTTTTTAAVFTACGAVALTDYNICNLSVCSFRWAACGPTHKAFWFTYFFFLKNHLSDDIWQTAASK